MLKVYESGGGELDNFREWLSDNLRYILLGLAVVLVVIIGFCIFRLVGGSSSKKTNTGNTPTAAPASQDQEDTTEKTASVSISAPAPGEGLTMNDEKLLALAKKYYGAVSAEDEQTLATIVEPWNDTVKEETFALNEKFKSFDNITSYSKDGPADNSWLVYVYCECKVDGVDTGIPTLLNPLVVITTDSSDLKISSDRAEYVDFINESNASPGVQTLINEVNKQYEDLKGADTQVQNYGTDGSASSSGQNQEASTEAGASSGSSSSGSYGTATATDSVNIRSEGSTNGAVLGGLYPGQEVTIVSTEGDWTHINYTDPATGSKIDGYVSSKYLKVN